MLVRIMRRRRCQRVASVVVHIYTTKTGESIGDAIPKTIARDSDESSRLIDDLVDFVTHTKLVIGDELFTVYRSEATKSDYRPKNGRNKQLLEPRIFRKVVRRREVAIAIKDSCRANNLPEKHFSTKSIRMTYATNASIKGVPEEVANKVANWKTNAKTKTSTTKQKHYDHSSIMPTARSDKQVHLADLTRMIPERTIVTRAYGKREG